MIFGGPGVVVSEICTYAEHRTSHYGAEDPNMAQCRNYPRSFAINDGKVVHFDVTPTIIIGEAEYRVMSLDPTGAGALEQVATLPLRSRPANQPRSSQQK
ncbi:MAG: hypothetical protein AAGA70_03085 [Pseudomonadota bacterium]